MAVDLAPLEGLVVAWSALVGCGRRRRRSIVNPSRSVRGSGGCLVGSGRVWVPATLFHCKWLAPLEGLMVAWSALVGCGRRRRCSIVNGSRSGSVRGSGGCLVGSGRVWAPATLFHCKSQ